MTTEHPTGYTETRDGRLHLVFERRFTAPIGAVWAAVTESDRLARWIGSYTGDPRAGRVSFEMTAEGDDLPAEDVLIRECVPPHRLVVELPDPDGGAPWVVTVDLAEAGGRTVLTFAQAMADPEFASSVGPGWDYYLDRLVAAESGGRVGDVSFEQYYPARADHYRTIVAQGG